MLLLARFRLIGRSSHEIRTPNRYSRGPVTAKVIADKTHSTASSKKKPATRTIKVSIAGIFMSGAFRCQVHAALGPTQKYQKAKIQKAVSPSSTSTDRATFSQSFHVTTSCHITRVLLRSSLRSTSR